MSNLTTLGNKGQRIYIQHAVEKGFTKEELISLQEESKIVLMAIDNPSDPMYETGFEVNRRQRDIIYIV